MDLLPRLAASTATFRDVPLAEAAQRLRALGFAQVDLTAIRDYCEHFDPLLVDVGEAECYRVRDVLAEHSLRAASLTGYPANPLDRHINRDEWVDMMFGYVACAVILEAPLLVLPAGNPAPPDDRWRGEVEHAKPWIRDAAQRALNAHVAPALVLGPGSLLNSSTHARELLAILDIPSLGIAIDTARLAQLGEDPARAIRELGGAIAHVTLRDTDGHSPNLPPGTGILDFNAILDALIGVGYTGPLVLSIDNEALTVEARADALVTGWHYLDRISLPKAA
jgi:sugar phosphate isomerase/epimerase